jgi:hypothetical protein
MKTSAKCVPAIPRIVDVLAQIAGIVDIVRRWFG